MSEEAALPSKGCFPKVSNTWRAVFGAFTAANKVHPSDPVPPKDSEFIYIESKIKLRVIHLIPSKQSQCVSSKRNSVSDEYWFMRSKPLRNSVCRCSFRNSIIKNSHGTSIQNDQDLNLVSKSTKVEQYAEQLTEKTLNEALIECITKPEQNGIDNIAYERSEVDSVVILRNNIRQSEKNGETSSLSRNCVHKRIKPLIILIHGLGSTAEIWNILMHNLSCKGFEVVALDLLGHGFSSAPNKASLYHFKNLLSQTIAVFDYFMQKDDDKRKCILIGHSYGCSLITALYPNRAAKIAQLVLISGGGPTPLAPPADLNHISPYGCAHNFCYPFMYCGLKRSFFYSSRGKNFKFCEEETSVPPHLKNLLIEGQYWPEGDASFHRRILVPTLLVHGLQDKNVTLVQQCEMERTIPRSFLELIPDAGHMSMLESPEHLTHMVICFIEMWS